MVTDTTAAIERGDAAVEPLPGEMKQPFRIETLLPSLLLVEEECSIAEHGKKQGQLHAVWGLFLPIQCPEILVLPFHRRSMKASADPVDIVAVRSQEKLRQVSLWKGG
jgi:hypothetical protein